MKRGKRFFENDKLLIYVGTAIFFILAVVLGIIMYMTTKTGFKMENETNQINQEQQIGNETESVNTDIGKTVEEQTSNTNSNGTDDVETDNTGKLDTEENKETTNMEKEEVMQNNEDETTKVNEDIENNEETEAKNEVDEPDVPSNENQDVNQTTETKNEVNFVKPVDGEIICDFAKDNLIYSETLKEWITHTAIDIKADKTSVIKSAADGVVKSIVNDPRYGLTVVISHDDGYETVYSNLLTAEFVVEGEEVTQGQTIGTAGNTASFESNMESHLHFELIKDGEYLDPKIYLK